MPCDRCPCPAHCLGWDLFCGWAAADPPDPAKLEHIRLRSAVREGPTPTYPPLLDQAGNFAGAVGRAVAAAVRGEPVKVPADVLEGRKATCRACPRFDAAAGRCTLCGCYTAVKLTLATEACPEGKW
jgi:hypothetical protein